MGLNYFFCMLYIQLENTYIDSEILVNFRFENDDLVAYPLEAVYSLPGNGEDGADRTRADRLSTSLLTIPAPIVQSIVQLYIPQIVDVITGSFLPDQLFTASVVDPNTLNLDPDPRFWPNLLF